MPDDDEHYVYAIALWRGWHSDDAPRRKSRFGATMRLIPL